MRDWYAVLDEQLGETLQIFENLPLSTLLSPLARICPPGPMVTTVYLADIVNVQAFKRGPY
jgi:hypothetical protein